MKLEQLQAGDIVYAAADIFNDGSIPGIAENSIIAKKGSRGVLVNTGYLEENEDQAVYLVRFESESQELGNPVGCWPEDLAASNHNAAN